MIDLSTLNTAQREAVTAEDPRILCLAGAGTGKTAVLTHRIAYIHETYDVPCDQIAALTFTRAAGAEMQQRLIALIGDEAKDIFCSTIHAFCLNIIREYATSLGYDADLTVMDQADAEAMQESVLHDLKVHVSKRMFARALAGEMNGVKSAAVSAGLTIAIREYEYRCKRSNTVDFDSLIRLAAKALRVPNVSAQVRERYQDIFVDEFQDTDAMQFDVIKAINPPDLFVVGDDFQSIYQFRGSDVSIIMGLAESMAWHTIRLETNYRSTAQIVDAANSLIKHNHQTAKTLTALRDGPAVGLTERMGADKEIVALVPSIQAALASHQTCAILARTNRQVSDALMALRMAGVPCDTPQAAEDPMSSSDAKVLLRWIDVMINPSDSDAIAKVVAPKMPRSEFLRCERAYLDGHGTLRDALMQSEQGRAALDIIRSGIREYQSVSHNLDPMDDDWDYLTLALGRMAYGRFMIPQALYDRISRWEEDRIAADQPHDAKALLEWARTLGFSSAAQKDMDPERCHVMTIHGSKGLEFDAVWIIGCVEGSLPSRGDVEEERRLMYVAMTRAKTMLTLSVPSTTLTWGGDERPAECSRFVGESGLL
jgi:DNA helicase-2/ATP-dependent DNA helicase PcrA